MPRKSVTHRPLKALRHHEAAKVRPRERAAERPLLDAERLPERPRRVPPPRAAHDTPEIRVSPKPVTPSFDVTQRDGRLEGVRSALPARRRRSLTGTPTATCDLHGHDAARARRKLEAFLVSECARGQTLVLVIVGRGHNSAGKRPVLRREIVDWLTSEPLAQLVLAFHTAPPEFGGEGSLLVRLSRENT